LCNATTSYNTNTRSNSGAQRPDGPTDAVFCVFILSVLYMFLVQKCPSSNQVHALVTTRSKQCV